MGESDDDTRIHPSAAGAEDFNKAASSVPDEQEQDEEEEDEFLFGLNDSDIAEILDALHEGYDDAVVDALHDLSPADAAELLYKITPDERAELLQKHGAAFDPYTFTELTEDLRAPVMRIMSAPQIAAILSELESDDALDLVLDLDPEFQHEIIRLLSAKLRMTLEQGLSFPEDSAGRLMQREFVAIPQFWTVGKTIDYLRAAAPDLPDEFYDIFVITPTYRIVGEIPLSRIIRAKRAEKLEDLKQEETHPIPATMDQEDVADLFRRENLTSAPVVDEEERIIGVITIDDVVDVIDEEAQEDLMAMSGVSDSDIHRTAMNTSLRRSRWLFVNVFTALAAACVISIFAQTIEQIVALAILMPVVASMGGNAGMQALTVSIRALATRDLSSVNAGRVIIKEIMVGAINGAIFAILVGMVAALWFRDGELGMVIAAAMTVNFTMAGLFGASIPVVLNHFDIDPAAPSPILLTTMTDIIGFFVFLGLAAVVLL